MYILLLEISAVAWLVTRMEPLQYLFEKFAEKSGIFNTLFYEAVSCWKCLTFWLSVLGLIVGGFGIWQIVSGAALASMFVAKFEKMTKK